MALSVRPLCDKFGSAVSNGVVGQAAILAGMTTGAVAGAIPQSGVDIFKLIMIVIPAVLLVISVLIFWRKVKLNEKMHDSLVKMLNLVWPNGEEEATSSDSDKKELPKTDSSNDNKEAGAENL